MKTTRRLEDIDSLLGRGGIGATRRDAIFDRVLASVKVEAPTRKRWSWLLVGFSAAAAAAATAMLLLVPRASPPGLSPFHAKGTTASTPVPSPSAQIECLGATLGACPIGSLLVVRVAGVRGFVSAWAERDGKGERIWYFSSETHTPLVDAVATPGAATTRAVRIGPEHRAGSYVVQVRVTERAMAREELLHLPRSAVLAEGQTVLTVTSP